MSETREIEPRVETFAIGEAEGTIPATATEEVGRVKHNKSVTTAPIFGVVGNLGRSALTFSVEESSDDGGSDTYAAVNIRVAGAAVASVSVVPGGRVVFAIEGAVEAYLKLKAAGDAPYGYVALASWFGDMERWMPQ